MTQGKPTPGKPTPGRLTLTRDRLVVMAITALAVGHALAVAPHYIVGSFDDDSHYLALGLALLHGHGFVDASAPGSPAETLYPPGYPALLVPLLWIGGGATWVLRAFSVVLFGLSVPLMDVLCRRQGLSDRVRIAALLLYALNPVAATFASMIMTELPFIVTLLLVMIAMPGWLNSPKAVSWRGGVVALGAPYLLALKIAGLPLTAGFLLWIVVRRRWRHLWVALCGSALELLPIFVYRLTGGSVVGQRYTSEYASTRSIVRATFGGIGKLINGAIPNSVMPVIPFHLQDHGPLVVVGLLVRYTAAAFVLIGFIRWARLRADAMLLIVPLYLVEVLPFPFVNERRVILILPVVLAWYALGIDGTFVWVRARISARRDEALPRWLAPTSVGVISLLGLALLAGQFTRDYLLTIGQTTPSERGSNYIAALRIADPPGWSIATGYRWTTALWTGDTASNVASFDFTCPLGQPGNAALLHQMLTGQHVAVDLSSHTKFPDQSDNQCIANTLPHVPWAVPIFSGTDDSTIWDLLGPGTAHADETSLPTEGLSFTNPGNDEVDEISVEVDGNAGPPPKLELVKRPSHDGAGDGDSGGSRGSRGSSGSRGSLPGYLPATLHATPTERHAAGFYDWTIPAALARHLAGVRISAQSGEELTHFVVLGSHE